MADHGQSAGPSAAAIGRRRAAFAILVVATVLAMLALMVRTLSTDGIDMVDGLMLFALLINLPWTVIGFLNACFGLALTLFARDPETTAAPLARHIRGDEPITGATAILVCIRNEEPARLRRNLDAMLGGLIASGAAPHLHCFVLSDTNRPEIAGAEEALAADLALRFGSRLPVTYRRRPDNPGFKAGNIRDFCDRWGSGFAFALVLDADSFMSTEAMLRLIRTMQATPTLGILQSLVVGMPTASAFARLFQFGMRLGMRSYTLGSAFWQADCGPYWGHNAIIRLAPFIAHCHLPRLRGGRWVLSHDQVEAVLMRRAGYEVRILPVEDASWEENPPTLPEFIRRDLRWCQGNMQYWQLLATPGLLPVSRIQLVLAILMFLGSPAWVGMVTLFTIFGVLSPTPIFDPLYGTVILLATLAMVFAPKIASVIVVLLLPEQRRAFGGAPRFAASVLVEVLFMATLAPIVAVAHTVFLCGLPFGRTMGWTAQLRDDQAVPFAVAWKRLWPQTLLGIAGILWVGVLAPWAFPYLLPFVGPLAIAIPYAMVSASPDLGLALARLGVGRLPEETAPPAALLPLALPAVVVANPGPPALRAEPAAVER